MDERETRDGARGEAVPTGPAFGGSAAAGGPPPPEDSADLPPLPPPPPVGAELPAEPTDEELELPDQAYEPPPTPLAGLWPGAAPLATDDEEEEDPEVAALMAAFSDPSPAPSDNPPEPVASAPAAPEAVLSSPAPEAPAPEGPVFTQAAPDVEPEEEVIAAAVEDAPAFQLPSLEPVADLYGPPPTDPTPPPPSSAPPLELPRAEGEESGGLANPFGPAPLVGFAPAVDEEEEDEPASSETPVGPSVVGRATVPTISAPEGDLAEVRHEAGTYRAGAYSTPADDSAALDIAAASDSFSSAPSGPAAFEPPVAPEPPAGFEPPAAAEPEPPFRPLTPFQQEPDELASAQPPLTEEPLPPLPSRVRAPRPPAESSWDAFARPWSSEPPAASDPGEPAPAAYAAPTSEPAPYAAAEPPVVPAPARSAASTDSTAAAAVEARPAGGAPVTAPPARAEACRQPVPRQLPVATAHFVGRSAELEALAALPGTAATSSR